MKNQKGITLIALIITVIIMVILAAFAISTALGQDGLVKTVDNAMNEWRNAENTEREAINTILTNLQESVNSIQAQ